MSELIAKVGKENKNVLSQEENILDVFNLSDIETVDYNPDFKLDDDQWFQINKFSTSSFRVDECFVEFSTTSLNQIENKDYCNISSICVIQGNNRFFQRITHSLYANKKRFIEFSSAPKIVEQNNQIQIRDVSDAIYLLDKDSLIFKDISKIKTIFPGIGELQREATQTEVENFLDNDFIKLSNFNSKSVGILNRARIADIGKKYEKLSEPKRDQLINYAKRTTGIKHENGTFIIESDVCLKNLLYAMDERYYYAEIYAENRLANSVRVIKNDNLQ